MDKKEWACLQLQIKYRQLGRLPTKADFDDRTRVAIKAALGPWPRALEAAGVKPVAKYYPENKKEKKRDIL